jgi:carbonic anhydrase
MRKSTSATMILLLLSLAGCGLGHPERKQHVLTPEMRDRLSPTEILEVLMQGNRDFARGEWLDWDFSHEQRETATGQYPGAVILSCIDSRAPAEIIFNVGIGDMFNARVAGNFVNTDIAGSLEYGCKVAGAKVILVLGHTNCGAVKSVCDGVEMGNITSMLESLKPALEAVGEVPGERSSKNKELVSAVAVKNIELTMAKIRELSPILAGMEANGEILIAGAMYDVANGRVELVP